MDPAVINVAFCTDKGYVAHLATAMRSMFEHNTAERVQVHVVATDLDNDTKARLDSIAGAFDRHIVFVDVPVDRFSHLGVHAHFSHAIYLRFSLPELVKVAKIIYLDCDLVVETSLRDLWNTDIASFGCAGMPELGERADVTMKRLGITGDSYVNSGILLLNLDYWREHATTARCMEWVEANRNIAFNPDQDAINVVLKGKKVLLSERWNCNPVPNGNLDKLAEFPQRILHFAGPIKPWHRYYDFALIAVYTAYRLKTPWGAGFAPEEPRNVSQSLVVADQLFLALDYREAVIYYNHALRFLLKKETPHSILEHRVLNKAGALALAGDYQNAGDLYRAYFENLGYPIGFRMGLYAYPDLRGQA